MLPPLAVDVKERSMLEVERGGLDHADALGLIDSSGSADNRAEGTMRARLASMN
jgi:hypothetical protein